MWITLDAGYAIGGSTILNGVETDTRISSFRFGSTFAIPFLQAHVIRLTLNTGVRLEKGSDFDSILLTYQYRWFKKHEK